MTIRDEFTPEQATRSAALDLAVHLLPDMPVQEQIEAANWVVTGTVALEEDLGDEEFVIIDSPARLSETLDAEVRKALVEVADYAYSTSMPNGAVKAHAARVQAWLEDTRNG